MVRITVYIEGGVLPGDNISAQTIDNSEKFRESFYQIFQELIQDNKFNLDISPSGPNKQAIKFFQKNLAKGLNSILVIDLDETKDKKGEKYQEFGILDNQERVFFMVQQMEAWILSQIDKLEIYAAQEDFARKHVDQAIEEDPLIRGIHPEKISEPSKKLNVLLRKYFSIKKMRRGKAKESPKSYGKLKDGPYMIELLSVKELIETFEDVKDLKDFFNN
ncbi:MAG: hypothetical protein DHS20C18_34460 [Saprospiraceae bacterium]|nr:MAG: hypothetical protein DHS20C18_34460 [Saprospiraceae bacterium]